MSMLLYKAWVETQTRFWAGLIAVVIVCAYHINSHAWLVEMWTREWQDPKGYHFSWMPLGIHDYSWYLWHYLYNNYLLSLATWLGPLRRFILAHPLGVDLEGVGFCWSVARRA
jgi:hypothetical protein